MNSNAQLDDMFVNPFDEYSNDIIDMLPSEYIYAEMFKVLDANEAGLVKLKDVEKAAKSMGFNDRSKYYYFLQI